MWYVGAVEGVGLLGGWCIDVDYFDCDILYVNNN